jgi:hypothetical protein
MAIIKRETPELTESEIHIFGQYCLEKEIKTDPANIEVLAAYLERWNVVVNLDSLEKATVILRDAGQLQFYSEAETAYRKIAATEPERAAQLAHWFENFNKTLIKTGDENWSNQALLLDELRGREINSPNVHAAIGRISSTRGGLQYTPVERKPDSRQHVDDGKGFLRDEKNPRYRNGRIDHAYREPVTEAPKVSTPDARQEMCKTLIGTCPNIHSRQAEMLSIYTSPGKTYRQIYQELLAVKNSWERVGRI